jgi:hypothetical protein
MYASASDERTRTLVGIQGGPPATEADFEQLLTSIEEWAAFSPPLSLRTRILVIDEGQPALPASWRKRIAEATQHAGPSRVAIVTTATDQLRTMTAIAWIREQRGDRRVVSKPTFDEAVLWMEQEVGYGSAIFHKLYGQARYRLNVGRVRKP